jgi:hypothetical protein
MKEVEEEEGPVTFQLQDMVSRGKIQPDPHQLAVARELDRVYHDLMATDPPPLIKHTTTTTTATMTPTPLSKPNSYFPVSFFGNIFGQATTAMADAATNSLGFDSPEHAIPGVYSYGSYRKTLDVAEFSELFSQLPERRKHQEFCCNYKRILPPLQ